MTLLPNGQFYCPFAVYCGSCTDPEDTCKMPTKYADLLICDPPFGIQESGFDKHYARNQAYVLEGYLEAPSDYAKFTFDWMTQAKRVLKDDGALFVIIGHSSLIHVLNAAEELKFHTINHIIWKYNFGVYTRRKFVTSHYHVLYLAKHKDKRKFNLNCRFANKETDYRGRKILYQDMEDVWVINRDYSPGEKKNQNKLPDDLCEKIIQYTSNPGDIVGDFFLGNFTTAIAAKRLGRIPCGFEINYHAWEAGVKKLESIEIGELLDKLPEIPDDKPLNQGKKITKEERRMIIREYKKLIKDRTQKEAIDQMSDKFGRGRFSILNIVKKGSSK